MIRPILHVPTGRRFDLATEIPASDVEFLASLRENQAASEHQLLCETSGGDQRLYVWRTPGGHLMARHFPGGGHEGGHRILSESDEHKRCKEYNATELERLGIPAATEVTTNNHTRLDVATLDAPRITGIEVQFTAIPEREYKARATKSMHATAFTGKHARQLTDGVLPVWLHPHGIPPGYRYLVPSVAAQDTRWDITPRPGSVTAIGIRTIEAEKCWIGSRWRYCPRTGRSYCGSTHPLAVLSPGRSLSEVIALTANAGLVPLRYHTGAVYLVAPEDAARYEELGGQGEYIAGTAGERVMARKLGPCQNPGHQEPASPAASPFDIEAFRIPADDPVYRRALAITEPFLARVRQDHERERARRSAAESRRIWEASVPARTAGRCRILELGREGCGCVTCRRELGDH